MLEATRTERSPRMPMREIGVGPISIGAELELSMIDERANALPLNREVLADRCQPLNDMAGKCGADIRPVEVVHAQTRLFALVAARGDDQGLPESGQVFELAVAERVFLVGRTVNLRTDPTPPAP